MLVKSSIKTDIRMLTVIQHLLCELIIKQQNILENNLTEEAFELFKINETKF